MDREELINTTREHVFFTWSVQNQVNPIPIGRAEGVYFWDMNGKRYIDFASQQISLNAGHGNRKIIDGIKAQLDKIQFAFPGAATEPKALLGKMLAEITPGDLCKTMFTVAGAEANENAIKLARLFTGRHKILARYRSYHGASAGAMALSGDPRRLPVEPLIPGIIHVLDPYCYRCPFGWTLETCHRECIQHVEQVIQLEGPQYVAGLMLEGITGSSGIIIPPDDYWPRMREICDKYDVVLMDDEVMSGFGRTGKWFGVDHYGVVPDVMTMAKGITSSYFPLGAVIVNRAIADHFEDRPFPLGLTYAGHPVGTAAGVATIQAYQEQGLIDNAREMGALLEQGLRALQEKHPSVGDVRCIGLFAVLELVKNRETKEPLAPWNAQAHELGVMTRVKAVLGELGMLTDCKWNWIFATPPLCINRSELREGLEILDRALDIADTGCD